MNLTQKFDSRSDIELIFNKINIQCGESLSCRMKIYENKTEKLGSRALLSFFLVTQKWTEQQQILPFFDKCMMYGAFPRRSKDGRLPKLQKHIEPR